MCLESSGWFRGGCLYNSNRVVSEFMVAARQFKLRHVAVGTVFFRNLAERSPRFSAAVTSQTLAVVKSSLSLKFFVRIVASEATDARVTQIVAFAERQPVWLKANCLDLGLLARKRILQRSMALSAEIGNFVG